MDKGGHVLNAYYESTWAYGLFNWAGLPENKAIWYSALTSTVIQSTIEIFDGFSEQWGFSWGDVLANSAGTALASSQQAFWGEQRIWVKFSFYPQDYPAGELSERADNLFGTAFTESLLKDYNGLTYWLSASPAQFIQGDSWWPAWLALSMGYGAKGLYGGFENTWCGDSEFKSEDCPDGLLIDRRDIPRVRQYYLSLDIDFTKIETQKPFLRTLFGVINVLKIPAPALEYNSDDGFRGHWIYF
jgi:hypothetical protein